MNELERRAISLIKGFESGRTLQQLGGQYGISRQRVQQILKRYGISGEDGGRSKRTRDNAAAAKIAVLETLLRRAKRKTA